MPQRGIFNLPDFRAAAPNRAKFLQSGLFSPETPRPFIALFTRSSLF